MSTSERLIVIQSENPEKFQEEFNAVLEQYSDCNLKYEFVHNLGHCISRIIHRVKNFYLRENYMLCNEKDGLAITGKCKTSRQSSDN